MSALDSIKNEGFYTCVIKGRFGKKFVDFNGKFVYYFYCSLNNFESIPGLIKTDENKNPCLKTKVVDLFTDGKIRDYKITVSKYKEFYFVKSIVKNIDTPIYYPFVIDNVKVKFNGYIENKFGKYDKYTIVDFSKVEDKDIFSNCRCFKIIDDLLSFKVKSEKYPHFEDFCSLEIDEFSGHPYVSKILL